MAKYIKGEEFVAWLKRIPVKDLSDGLGLCRIIMYEDFKRAIRTIPKGAIVDLEPVVRCNACKKFKTYECPMCNLCGYDDFCSYGERRADNGKNCRRRRPRRRKKEDTSNA